MYNSKQQIDVGIRISLSLAPLLQLCSVTIKPSLGWALDLSCHSGPRINNVNTDLKMKVKSRDINKYVLSFL